VIQARQKRVQHARHHSYGFLIKIAGHKISLERPKHPIFEFDHRSRSEQLRPNRPWRNVTGFGTHDICKVRTGPIEVQI
jgi:hypothetical protein